MAPAGDRPVDTGACRETVTAFEGGRAPVGRDNTVEWLQALGVSGDTTRVVSRSGRWRLSDDARNDLAAGRVRAVARVRPRNAPPGSS